MIGIFNADKTTYSIPDVQLQPISCELSQELNGVWQVTLEYSTADDRFKHIVENAVIQVPTPHSSAQLFRIYNVQKTLNSVIAYALPIFTDAGREAMLLDVRPTNRTGQQALDMMMQGTKYSGESNITDVATAYYVRKNLLEAIAGDEDNAFLKRWGGEILYDNYKIIINKTIGEDRGMRVDFGFNMRGITEDISTADTVTRIIPIAFNGRTLPGSSPWVDSPRINSYPVVYTRVIEYPDIRLAEDNDGEGYATLEALYAALRAAAENEYDNGIDLPTINYDCDIVDLASTVEYESVKELVRIRLGDIVVCRNKRLNIETKAKAIAITYDCIMRRITSIQLGDYRKTYFDRLTEYAGQISQTTTSNGEVKGETISGVINLMEAKLKAARDHAEPQSSRAILFEDNDKLSATYGAMALGTTGFEIASDKDANGNWIWSTFGTGQGFYADAIIAGILYSQNYTEGKQGFKIDLNTGDIYASRLNYYGKELGAYVQDKIDESAEGGEVYVTDYIPTLANYPAKEWHKPLYPAINLFPPQVWEYTEDIYEEHRGDMVFDALNGLMYVFKSVDGEWGWQQMPPSSTQYIMRQLASLTVETDKISTSVESLSAELKDDYWTIKQTQSAITQTAEEIKSEVSATYTTLDETEQLSSVISQTAEKVESKVSRGDVSSTISQEAGKVDIKAGRFTWTSDNSSMDSDGKIKVSNIEITGGSINMPSNEISSNIRVTGRTSYTDIDGYSVQVLDSTTHMGSGFNKEVMGIANAQGAISLFAEGDSVQTGTHTTQNMQVNGNLFVAGGKYRIIKHKDYGHIAMNAIESLGAFFSDIGSATITDGSAIVMIDDRMSVTCEAEYYIMITSLEGYVERIEKHRGYFIAYGEGKFDFIILAKQKGYADVYGDSQYESIEQKDLIPYSIAERYAMEIVRDYIKASEEGVNYDA